MEVLVYLEQLVGFCRHRARVVRVFKITNDAILVDEHLEWELAPAGLNELSVVIIVIYPNWNRDPVALAKALDRIGCLSWDSHPDNYEVWIILFLSVFL